MNLVSILIPLIVSAAADKAPASVETGGAKEITILQALRDRRVELDNREAMIKAREEALNKLRKEMEERIENTSREIAKLEARLNIGEPARLAKEKRIVSLVDALSSLSAKKAAPMLVAADPALVGELLMRLGPQRSAALLAVMPATQAGHLVDQVGQAKALAAIKAQEQPSQPVTPPAPASATPNPADASADTQGPK